MNKKGQVILMPRFDAISEGIARGFYSDSLIDKAISITLLFLVFVALGYILFLFSQLQTLQ